MRLLDPTWLHALWAVPAAVLLLIAGSGLSRRGLRRFFGEAADRSWAGKPRFALRVIKGTMVVLALAALAVALARPAYNPQPRKAARSGRDIVFLLDVSRSMLAQDLAPNRLERAKLAIGDVLDAARGDRVAIIAFAGSAVVRCPLTTDYSFARMALDDLTPDSVSRGGTAIGDAIRTAMSQLFASDTDMDSGRFRDIFLLTDGEDHESFPIEAAQQAGQRGVRIIAIGLGSESVGASVPAASGESMRYEGQDVKSRLDPRTLERLVAATPGGVFLNVGTGNIELDRVYQRLVRDAQQRNIDSAEVFKYTELFQALVGLAAAFLLLEVFISDARR